MRRGPWPIEQSLGLQEKGIFKQSEDNSIETQDIIGIGTVDGGGEREEEKGRLPWGCHAFRVGRV